MDKALAEFRFLAHTHTHTGEYGGLPVRVSETERGSLEQAG